MPMPAIFSEGQQFFPREFAVFCVPRPLPQRDEIRNTLQNAAIASDPPRGRRIARSVLESGRVSRFLLCRFNVLISRLFGPASPTASPESEFLSHGSVASRGVCKGAPHKF